MSSAIRKSMLPFSVITNLFLLDIHVVTVSAASCSFACSITNNQDKVPFYTGPYCSNDPLGWAFGRIALIPHCGKTCSMLEAECNDNPSDPNGIMPQVLNRDFVDCCDDYEPSCPFCRHGLVEPNAYSTEETLYRRNRISDPVVSYNFNATCAELEAYYDMEVSSSNDEGECDRTRHFFLTLDDESTPSRTYLAGCQCDPGPPTISPAPTEIASPAPSMFPTSVPTQDGLLCTIENDDYSNPGWYYGAAAASFFVYFIPTFWIALVLIRGFGSPKKTIVFNLVCRFLSDLSQGVFILINAYAYHSSTERFYCNDVSFQLNYITASFALGMDFISDIIALGTMRKVQLDGSDSIESAKWKCMEYMGGWVNNFFCVISATGAALIGGSLIFGSTEVDSTILIITICLYFSITAGGILFQLIYDGLYDENFSFTDWCAAQCSFNPCRGFKYSCEYNSWRNKDGSQPHTGPVWGGAARVFLEYATIALMVIELLLNLESNIATIVLLSGALVGKIFRLLSASFNCDCCA